MKHGRKTIKLQRNQDHRDALISNLIVSLIEHKRIKTTLAKAKAVRPFAEKILTLGKRAALANANQTDGKDTPTALHCRRIAIAKLDGNKGAVKHLFAEIAPASAGRVGGYTRITKLGQRRTDSAPMAFIEWVDTPKVLVAPVAAAPEAGADEEAKDEGQA
ncbi:MAG: rplQ [Verrucomicrobiaceae bacterium]|nr:rplQ [Verrucomicrobiaceae bacterium]MDB6116863.1 rplQ [Verrucomicrobiaceae bacterium]